MIGPLYTTMHIANYSRSLKTQFFKNREHFTIGELRLETSCANFERDSSGNALAFHSFAVPVPKIKSA